jgi:hypothetical protein
MFIAFESHIRTLFSVAHLYPPACLLRFRETASAHAFEPLCVCKQPATESGAVVRIPTALHSVSSRLLETLFSLHIHAALKCKQIHICHWC